LKTFYRYFLLIAWVIVSADLASAQMLIEQGKVAEMVRPGETQSGQISVHNRSDQSLNVSAYLEDFIYVPPFEGQKKFLPAGSVERSCSSWINFTPQEFTLPSFGKQQINYTIRVPEDVSGGYYSVLFLEKKGFSTDTGIGVKIVSRVGSLFFLEAQQHSRRAVVQDIKVSDGLVRGTVKNEGDIILVVKGVHYSLDQDGRAVDRGEIKGLYLPPDESGQFEIAIPEEGLPGRYTYVLTFDLGESGSAVAEADIEIAKDGTARLLEVRE